MVAARKGEWSTSDDLWTFQWHHYSATVRTRMTDTQKAQTLILYVDYTAICSFKYELDQKYADKQDHMYNITNTGLPAQMNVTWCTVEAAGSCGIQKQRSDSLMDYNHSPPTWRAPRSVACDSITALHYGTEAWKTCWEKPSFPFNVFQKRLSGVTWGTSMECLAFFLNRRLKFIDLQS